MRRSRRRPLAQVVVARVTNQPDTCAVFYEIGGVLSGDGATSEAFHLVFRGFENTREPLPGTASTSPIANFKFSTGVTPARDAFFNHAGAFDTAMWRVRPVNGAGLASPWSALVRTCLTFTR